MIVEKAIEQEPKWIPVLDLKNIISESREFAQAVNEFADELERIENKYGTETEDEEYEMVDLGSGIFEKRYLKKIEVERES